MTESQYKELWKKIIKESELHIEHEGFYNEYIKKTELIKLEQTKLFINSGTLFAKTVLNENYKILFTELARKNFNMPVDVIFISNDETKIILSNSTNQNINYKTPVDTGINIVYNFDNFIVANFNERAYKAMCKIVSYELLNEYNPIFIYGNTGLGKTHLLHATGEAFLRKNYEKKVKIINANELTQIIVNAISSGNNAIELLKKEISNLDLLMIDDVQFLASRDKTNEIFFSIFNEMISKNRYVILTSDKPPNKLDGFADRMISRFNSGISIKIENPNIETLELITAEKIKKSKIKNKYTDDAIAAIINIYGKDIRQIGGAIKNIAFYLETNDDTDTVITKDFIDLLVKNKIFEQTKIKYDENIIIERICRSYNKTVDDVKSIKRDADIVFVRQLCIYVLGKKLNISKTRIGAIFQRDHSTVISSMKKIEKIIKNNDKLNQFIEYKLWQKVE